MSVIGLIVFGAFAIEFARTWWLQAEWRRKRERRRRDGNASS